MPTGPGIRFDSGVAQGGAIPGQFDSMIAKLIVSAPSRSACLTRARHALDELAIAGVPTVRKFDQAVLEQPAFVATDGDFGVYTRWIEEEFLPSVDVRTLADGKPGRRAAAPEPVESWVEVDANACDWACPLRSPPSPRWARGWPDWLEPAQRGTLPSRPILANRSSKPC